MESNLLLILLLDDKFFNIANLLIKFLVSLLEIVDNFNKQL